MRRLGLLFVLIAFGAQAQAATPVEIGPRLSIELRDSRVVIGGELRIGVAQIAPTVRLDIRPEFNFYFYHDFNVIDISADFLFAFNVRSDVAEPYFGVGLGVFDCTDCGGGNARLGVNLLGGVQFALRGTVHPFVELRFTAGDFDPILLTGGILFSL